MTTLVGTQAEFSEALKELCELDYDAAEAYQAAIDRLEDETYKQKLTEFKNDHVRHINEISAILEKHQIPAPTGPSAKELLTKGKVVLAGLVGDKLILSAMKTNEDDTNTAYERLNAYADKWVDSELMLRQGLEDERRHRAWLESVLR